MAKFTKKADPKSAKSKTLKAQKPTIKAKGKARAVAAKPKLKAAAKAPAGKVTLPQGRNGFMWKILEQKELERKKRENAEAHATSANPEDRAGHPGHSQHMPFAKFQGPRRRAS